MKFAAFKKEQKETVVERTLIHAKTGTRIGDRTVIRDTSSDPFDVECLDALTCPTCAEDVTVTPSPNAPNISYYTCVGPKAHQFLRLHRMMTTMDAARLHTHQVLEAARKNPRFADANVDHLGRPVD